MRWEVAMKLPRREFLHLAAGASALPTVSRVAWVQAYPARPITMVVGFAPGGSADITARVMAERMKASLGRAFVVENVSGAAGSVAAGRVARAAADGYTLGIGSLGTHVFNGALYTLPYDLLNDLQPISLLTDGSFVVVAKKGMPADDLKSFIAWLRANPGKASQGTPGPGSAPHVLGVFLQSATNTRFQLVPYRGGAPAMQDLAAGHIDFLIATAPEALPQVRLGNIKAYAVTAKTRIASAPDIPTADEAGLPGFQMSLWYGLWAPKGTSRDVISKLNAAVTDALADAAVRSRLADLGQDVVLRDQQTPEALAALQKAEIEKWWPIIKAANIKGE